MEKSFTAETYELGIPKCTGKDVSYRYLRCPELGLEVLQTLVISIIEVIEICHSEDCRFSVASIQVFVEPL
jgi:hypothetical protein